MNKRILIIQGHPDAQGGKHLCHVLAEAYAQGGQAGGHEVQVVDVATLDFPLLRSQKEWDEGPLPPALLASQKAIAWADHIVLFFPLWLGDMPAVLKGFLEQVARPGFALSKGGDGRLPAKLLTGRSARVVVTMGMPALIYRWYFRAHSVKALERNILGFVGIAPVRETLIGGVDGLGESGVATWCGKLSKLGRRAH